MQYRLFGKTGLRVSEFALGSGMLGRTDSGANDPTVAQAVLQQYVEAGGNLIDTSEAYGGGWSEERIGDFLADRREDIVLLSKYSRSTQPDASPGRVGNHRKAMVQSVEGSLRRLRTDRIDLYMAHLDDGVTPVEEIVRGFDDLVSAGKIVYAGLSNFPAWRTARAATLAEVRGWVSIAALEIEYNLLQRTAEREILPLAGELGMGVLGYSPLDGGVLRNRPEAEASTRALRPRAASLVDVPAVLRVLTAIAAEKATDAGAVALAWVVAKGITPILGARTERHLTESFRAIGLTLDEEHKEHLDTVSQFPLGYPQELLSRLR